MNLFFRSDEPIQKNDSVILLRHDEHRKCCLLTATLFLTLVDKIVIQPNNKSDWLNFIRTLHLLIKHCWYIILIVVALLHQLTHRFSTHHESDKCSQLKETELLTRGPLETKQVNESFGPTWTGSIGSFKRFESEIATANVNRMNGRSNAEAKKY